MIFVGRLLLALDRRSSRHLEDRDDVAARIVSFAEMDSAQ